MEEIPKWEPDLCTICDKWPGSIPRDLSADHGLEQLFGFDPRGMAWVKSQQTSGEDVVIDEKDGRCALEIDQSMDKCAVHYCTSGLGYNLVHRAIRCNECFSLYTCCQGNWGWLPLEEAKDEGHWQDKLYHKCGEVKWACECGKITPFVTDEMNFQTNSDGTVTTAEVTDAEEWANNKQHYLLYAENVRMQRAGLLTYPPAASSSNA